MFSLFCFYVGRNDGSRNKTFGVIDVEEYAKAFQCEVKLHKVKSDEDKENLNYRNFAEVDVNVDHRSQFWPQKMQNTQRRYTTGTHSSRFHTQQLM